MRTVSLLFITLTFLFSCTTSKTGNCTLRAPSQEPTLQNGSTQAPSLEPAKNYDLLQAQSFEPELNNGISRASPPKMETLFFLMTTHILDVLGNEYHLNFMAILIHFLILSTAEFGIDLISGGSRRSLHAFTPFLVKQRFSSKIVPWFCLLKRNFCIIFVFAILRFLHFLFYSFLSLSFFLFFYYGFTDCRPFKQSVT